MKTCAASSILADTYQLIAPTTTDSERDQNSVILLRKYKYKDIVEVTNEVLKEFPQGSKAPVAEGDLLAILVTDTTDGTKYLLCSFHGDTNGLATIPVVEAVHKYAMSKQRDAKLLFGMDANTYEKPECLLPSLLVCNSIHVMDLPLILGTIPPLQREPIYSHN